MYRRSHRLLAIASIALCAAALAACGRSRERGIELEPTPVVSGGTGWGVVTIAYVRLTAEPSWSSKESAAARRGEVGKILGRAREPGKADAGVWYEIDVGSGRGWLHESALKVYKRREEAVKAAADAK